jgi:hypothetical protein
MPTSKSSRLAIVIMVSSFLMITQVIEGWSSSSSTTTRATSLKQMNACRNEEDMVSIKLHSLSIGSKELTRRDAITKSLQTILTVATVPFLPINTSNKNMIAYAYTPDSDKLRESLYLISRVQEATVLQERYIQNKTPPIQKMKLTLRLVDKSYQLLDQITYVSNFIPSEFIVGATSVGNEAVEELQEAIDFVYSFKNNEGDKMTLEQKEFLKESLTTTREKLFVFLDYLPQQDKLDQARARVEEENKLNIEEFDGDADAGVYNPVVLPWKNRSTVGKSS